MEIYNDIHINIVKNFLCNVGLIVAICLLIVVVLLFFKKYEIARKLINLFIVAIFSIVVCSAIFILPRVNDILTNSYIVIHNGKISYSGNDGISFGAGNVYYRNGQSDDLTGLDFFEFSNPNPETMYYGTIVYGESSKQLILVEQSEKEKTQGGIISLRQ